MASSARIQEREGGKYARNRVKCPHTCPNRRCETSTFLQDTLRKHVPSEKLHPQCDKRCKESKDFKILNTDRKRRILFVLDPHEGSSTLESAVIDLHFPLVIDQRENLRELLQDERYKYHIWEPTARHLKEQRVELAKGQSAALISDMLEVFRQLPSDSFEKDVMPWSDFKNLFMADEQEALNSFDLIVPPGLANDLTDTEYDFKDESEYQEFILRLKSFDEEWKRCWPSVKELLDHGNKWLQIQDLNEIAVMINTPRPHSILLENPTSLPTGDEIVLKRTYSDRKNHVLIKPSRSSVRKVKTPAHTSWIQQEYLESFARFGELRVAIIEGTHILWRVHTWPGEKPDMMDYIKVTRLQSIERQDFSSLGDRIFDQNEKDTVRESEIYTKELDQFVLKTLAELIKRENARLHPRRSSLEFFARLDIHIMPDSNGKAAFFVNELERFPAVTLWTQTEDIGPMSSSLKRYLLNLS